jgi:AcrR family transcriptional regulator
MSTNKRSTLTRQEVLDRAWELIAARGAEVSMAEIARAAGISRQAVYLHFGTRGGLLMALVKRADDRFRIRESFAEALGQPTAEERLDAWLAAWFAFIVRIQPVARDLIRLRSTDADAASAWEDRMTDLRSWLREMIVTVEREGALRTEWSVDEAADYLWAASSVQMWDLLTGDRHWDAPRVGETLRRTIPAVLLRSDGRE